MDYARLEHDSYRTTRRTYKNEEPVSDPYEVLALLRNDFCSEEGVSKRMMPYPVMGPLPRGLSENENKWRPFVEHSWSDGAYGLEFSGANDFLITAVAAHKLIREEWVVQAESPYIFKISLTGIAVLAAHRKRMCDVSDSGGGTE